MKYIISYTNKRNQHISIIRHAESREEAMQKLCDQFGWRDVNWLSGKDWSDGIFISGDRGYEFRISEVK